MAFFDTQPDLQNSDKERIEFAKFYLEDLRFLYKDSKDKNKKVCDPEDDPSRLTITRSLEMEGALSQSLCPPDLCCSSWRYRGFHEGSWPPRSW